MPHSDPQTLPIQGTLDAARSERVRSAIAPAARSIRMCGQKEQRSSPPYLQLYRLPLDIEPQDAKLFLIWQGNHFRRGITHGPQFQLGAQGIVVVTLSHAAHTSHACASPRTPHKIAVPRASYNGYYLSFPS